MNELLSPPPFTSDLSLQWCFSPARQLQFTCIPFLASPRLVAILILFVKVQKRLGVPESFLLYPRLWGWEMQCCLPTWQPLGEGQVWPLPSLFPSQQVRSCGGHRGQAGCTLRIPLTKEGLRGMAVCSPLAAGELGCQGLCQRNSWACFQCWPWRLHAGNAHPHTYAWASSRERLTEMVGLTGAICPAFVYWSKRGLLSCTNWQSLLTGNGQAQPSPAESGKANLPWIKDHLQWQLGTTACCGLSHMCLLENLCSCITPSQLIQSRPSCLLEDIKHSVIAAGKQRGLGCSDGIWLVLHPNR